MERWLIVLTDPKRENTHHATEATQEAPVLVKRQKKRGSVDKHLYYGFCKKEQNRQGRQA